MFVSSVCFLALATTRYFCVRSQLRFLPRWGIQLDPGPLFVISTTALHSFSRYPHVTLCQKFFFTFTFTDNLISLSFSVCYFYHRVAQSQLLQISTRHFMSKGKTSALEIILDPIFLLRYEVRLQRAI